MLGMPKPMWLIELYYNGEYIISTSKLLIIFLEFIKGQVQQMLVFSYCDKILQKASVKEERFIFVHGFRDFGSGHLTLLFLGLWWETASWWGAMVEQSCSSHVAGRWERKKGVRVPYLSRACFTDLYPLTRLHFPKFSPPTSTTRWRQSFQHTSLLETLQIQTITAYNHLGEFYFFFPIYFHDTIRNWVLPFFLRLFIENELLVLFHVILVPWPPNGHQMSRECFRVS